jgi:hypothetical protein
VTLQVSIPDPIRTVRSAGYSLDDAAMAAN